MLLLSGVPDLFDRNKILSGYDLSHYQVPHCIKSFLSFIWLCNQKHPWAYVVVVQLLTFLNLHFIMEWLLQSYFS